jgi:hypothetical protein
MDDLSLPEVRRLVAAANALRRQSDASGSAGGSDARHAERHLDDIFKTSHTLAVYGTLAPGKPNHHVVMPLGGEWTDGLIEGDLLPMGWGAVLGGGQAGEWCLHTVANLYAPAETDPAATAF